MGLYASGSLQVWHLYVLGAWSGVFGAFQWPAISVLISTILDKEQYGRASGMMSIVESAPGVAAPFLAAMLLAFGGLGTVFLIDMATCVVAVASLAFIAVPRRAAPSQGGAGQASMREDLAFGFRFILVRPGLLGLMLMFAVVNLVSGMNSTMASATVLARTGNDALALGSVQSLASAGGLLGAIVMGAWGGPRVKVHGVFAGLVASGLLGSVVFAIGRSLPVMMAGAFAAVFFIPILNGSSQAIWQSKVAPAVQGKVFAARRVLAQLAIPVSLLVSGPLADRVLEPALASPDASRLASLFAPLVGTGPGAGMALLLLIAGVLLAASALVGILNPHVRNVERDLRDHDDALRPTQTPVSMSP